MSVGMHSSHVARKFGTKLNVAYLDLIHTLKFGVQNKS